MRGSREVEETDAVKRGLRCHQDRSKLSPTSYILSSRCLSQHKALSCLYYLFARVHHTASYTIFNWHTLIVVRVFLVSEFKSIFHVFRNNSRFSYGTTSLSFIFKYNRIFWFYFLCNVLFFRHILHCEQRLNLLRAFFSDNPT